MSDDIGGYRADPVHHARPDLSIEPESRARLDASGIVKARRPLEDSAIAFELMRGFLIRHCAGTTHLQ